MTSTRLLANVLVLGTLVGCQPRVGPPLPAPAPGFASLSGQVRTGSRGVPLGQVVVRLTDATRAVVDSTMTDADGRFTFQRVLSGSYTLDLVRIGFARKQRTVQLEVGVPALHRISMQVSTLGLHADCLGPDGRSMGAQYCR